jgi:hypothetical protein
LNIAGCPINAGFGKTQVVGEKTINITLNELIGLRKQEQTIIGIPAMAKFALRDELLSFYELLRRTGRPDFAPLSDITTSRDHKRKKLTIIAAQRLSWFTEMKVESDMAGVNVIDYFFRKIVLSPVHRRAVHKLLNHNRIAFIEAEDLKHAKFYVSLYFRMLKSLYMEMFRDDPFENEITAVLGVFSTLFKEQEEDGDTPSHLSIAASEYMDYYVYGDK